MRTKSASILMRFFHVAVMVICLMALACATHKRVDWNSRIGNYTYDQTVSDLGPPDKLATLSDGRIVADWITRRSGNGFALGTGMATGNVGVGVGHSIGSSQDHVLRLTFKDGQLEAWSKN